MTLARVADIDGYIAALPDAGRAVAQQVRRAIRTAAPQATETLRYGMPAFQIAGATIIYFAIWKKHVGLYPIYRGDHDYEALLAPYRTKADTVSLPLTSAVPEMLIGQIVRMQIKLAHGGVSGAPRTR